MIREYIISRFPFFYSHELLLFIRYYTCQKQPGSLGHEQVDADTFAYWVILFPFWFFIGKILLFLSFKFFGDGLW